MTRRPEGAPPAPSAAARTVRAARAWPAGACVAALGGCAVVPIGPGTPVRAAVVVAAAVLLVACAAALRSAPAIRAAVFVGACFGLFTAGMFGGWPPAATTAAVCVLPLGCLGLAGRHRALRPAASWLRRGAATKGTLLLGAVTVVASAVALVAWTYAVRPEPAAYLRDLQRMPFAAAFAGIVAFALVNAAWEEMLFRGVLLGELASVWGPAAAVAVQAVLFGAAHLGGFPSGVAGVLMAGAWGCALGVLRVRSGGILLPYVVHVCADGVIATLAVLLLR